MSAAEYETMYESLRFEAPTSRLAENGFSWGLPPRSQRARDKWEREADKILSEAFSKLPNYSEVRDAQGRRVWSLDQYQDAYGDIGGPDLFLDDAKIDPVDDLVNVASFVAGLTKSEEEIVTALAEGAPSGALGWTEPLAARFGKTPNNVRSIWHRARTKLRKEWAEEPPERPERVRPRSGMTGNGETVFIGQPRSWGVRIDPGDACQAMIAHELNPIRNSDWRYERSLTEDGWQLGDDNLWADLAPRWLA